jgi:hypothetical protein
MKACAIASTFKLGLKPCLSIKPINIYIRSGLNLGLGIWYCTLKLVQRKRIRVEVILPGVGGGLVVLAFQDSAIIAPVKPQQPRSSLCILALVDTLKVGSVQRCRYNSVLNPVDHHRQVDLWKRTVWLRGIGAAVICSRDGKEAILIPSPVVLSLRVMFEYMMPRTGS